MDELEIQSVNIMPVHLEPTTDYLKYYIYRELENKSGNHFYIELELIEKYGTRVNSNTIFRSAIAQYYIYYNNQFYNMLEVRDSLSELWGKLSLKGGIPGQYLSTVYCKESCTLENKKLRQIISDYISNNPNN